MFNDVWCLYVDMGFAVVLSLTLIKKSYGFPSGHYSSSAEPNEDIVTYGWSEIVFFVEFFCN